MLGYNYHTVLDLYVTMLGYNYHIPHDDRRKAQGTEGHRTDVGLLGCFPGRR